MKTLLLLIALIVISCQNNYIPKKPFIITGKGQWSNPDRTRFSIVDANGKQFYFEERTDKYNIGDTIK